MILRNPELESLMLDGLGGLDGLIADRLRVLPSATQDQPMIFPAFRFARDRFGIPAGLRMVREHSAWLTRMLGGKGGRKAPRKAPRIPTRRVSEGGYSKLMSTSSGRYRAERWWERTLERMKD